MKTMAEWFNWGIDKYGNSMVGVEQAYKHSIKNKACVDCLSKKDLIKYTGEITKSDYFLCRECQDYWKKKQTTQP